MLRGIKGMAHEFFEKKEEISRLVKEGKIPEYWYDEAIKIDEEARETMRKALTKIDLLPHQ